MDDMWESLKILERTMDAQLEVLNIKARLCRTYFLELVEQGFSEEEALELCKFYKMSEL